ncbi:cyanophycinase [Roseateles toxinivorans]|uniref:Peptidase S51-like protein n=1 Tax=Roseateles toxinivorans TaxID=270368 RepID=A0A4V3CSQ1_9BURK|nr:Type 1 glutamine amidotransferase-like domain-containing protein [Roseateles toxinivorans]TDP61272.1 peptidase S51-like protein [Roseateles toxinivorans]
MRCLPTLRAAIARVLAGAALLGLCSVAQAQSLLAQRWDFNDPAGTALPAALNSAPTGAPGQWIYGLANTETTGTGALRIGHVGSIGYSAAPLNIASADVYAGTVVIQPWDIRNGGANYAASTRPVFNFGFRTAAGTATSGGSLVADVQFSATAAGIVVVIRDSLSTFPVVTLPAQLGGTLTASLKVDKRVLPNVYTLNYDVAGGTGLSGVVTATAAAGAASNTRTISHAALAFSGNFPGTTNAAGTGPNTPPAIDTIAISYNELPVVDLPAANGRPSRKSNLLTFFDGNPVQSTQPPIGGPGLLLMGGGAEVNEAFTGKAYPIINGGDIVVLRISGSNGYQPYFFNTLVNELPAAAQAMLKPNSVETLFVDTREKANSAYVANSVARANMIWIAGGDQSPYIENWRDTALAAAVKAAYQRGAIIGGTSAGMVVSAEWMYDPGALLAVTSAEAVANPYRASMILSATKLFDLPLGFNLLAEPHFQDRDRMGRTLAFMARLRKDARSSLLYGVALDERTALFIDKDKIGTFSRAPLVAGKAAGDGYILREDRRKTTMSQVAAGLPLIYRNVQRVKLAPGQSFDFARGLSAQPALSLNVEGVVPTNPY